MLKRVQQVKQHSGVPRTAQQTKQRSGEPRTAQQTKQHNGVPRRARRVKQRCGVMERAHSSPQSNCFLLGEHHRAPAYQIIYAVLWVLFPRIIRRISHEAFDAVLVNDRVLSS